MGRYLLRRLLQGVAVLWLLTVIVFVISRLSGNPVDLLLPEGAPPEQRAAHDPQPRPRPAAAGAVRQVRRPRPAAATSASSIRFQTAAISLVLDPHAATIELASSALALAVVIGIPLGILAALYRGRVVDDCDDDVLTLGQAVPSFWLAILLILWLGVDLGWLPIGGRSGVESLIMPAVTLAIVPLVAIARITRASVIAVLPQDYVRTAEAKGLRRLHVMRATCSATG